MSFTKNLTRALNARTLTTYPPHEPLEYRLSKLSISKIKQEALRPEPDLRHVVGWASVNRVAGDMMYQDLVRSVELLRTGKKARKTRRDRALQDLNVQADVETYVDGRGRKKERREKKVKGE
ncbi:hypothetical protein BDV25DRAFT_159334 [Aspergillus avenaceus]|uniref:Uncharacterized protein n=1 Tax=Aspergillus avenaceus TaxID=36643 RepID=A0A5N6TNM0_ASPAV|nr:hypothetical protein BDV25DRAFT_159334 [Aspergillus avenaceus]